MIREPKIPMSPEELPQQRIHEVVALPKRPAEFDCKVGYGCSPKGGLPKNAPIKSTYLCQVEWAWSPAHNRLDAYYLHRGRSHWSLWTKFWDNNLMGWEQFTVGYVPRRGADRAATGFEISFSRNSSSTSAILPMRFFLSSSFVISHCAFNLYARSPFGKSLNNPNITTTLTTSHNKHIPHCVSPTCNQQYPLRTIPLFIM